MNIPKKYLTETVILVEKVHKVNIEQVLAVLTQSRPANKDDPNYEYYKKLAWWAENNREQIKKNQGVNLSDHSTKVNAKLNISDRSLINNKKLEKHYGTIVGVLDQLWILMTNEGKFGQNAEISKLIQQTTLEILAGLSGLNNTTPDPDPKPEPEPEPEPEAKSGKSRDWTAYRAEKLANANGKPTSKVLDEFYDEYYSIEYAGVESPEKDARGIVAKLKSLDKILIPEFNKLGYNIEVNPFASFLKILIKEKFDDIFKKLTYNTYGAIHNSFIEKYITGNMLGQKFDEKNILFCSDLYNKNGLDMVEYLNLQHQVNAAKKTSERADDTDLIAKIFIKQNIPQAQEGVEDSYSAKVKKLLDLKENINQPGQKDAKLRSLLEIRELYRYIFGKEADSATKKKQVTTQIADAIANKAEELQITLDMIGYILDQATYTASDKYVNDARKFEAWFDKLNHRSDRKNVNSSKEILSKYELTAYAFSLIIKNLINRVTKRSGNKT